MRNNGYLSGKLIELRDDQLIISRTDERGRIVYVNADFIEISGFSEEELLGQSHNVIRHPEMPPAVFADLWADIQAGRPWIGLIKNRNKNGDAYWIEAHVSPIREKGNISGFLSMRRKASAAQIAKAEADYASLRETGAKREVRHGRVQPVNAWTRLLTAFANASLATKFILSALLATSICLGGSTYLLAGHVSRTLQENARHQLSHDVNLLHAAVAARVESANIEVVEYSKRLRERVYANLGGRGNASQKTFDAMISRLEKSHGNPIESFLADLRGVGTIFSLTPEGLRRRLSTAIVENGDSAVGTLMAADHPALPVLMSGQTYVGPARVFGRQYLTSYVPIQDAGGQLIGAAVMGIDMAEQLETLKDQVRTMEVGKSGYYYIANATPGPDFGYLILHPYKEGKTIGDVRDHDGHILLAEMAAKRNGAITYSWKNEEAGELTAKEKLVSFKMLENPAWIVAGGTSIQEFTALSDRIVMLVIAGGTITAIAMVIIILILLRNLVLKPINTQILPTFQAISSGRFDTALEVTNNDEIGQGIQGLENLRNRLAFESERERSLSAMRENARLEAEALSRARAEFLANMSHEIRTPLNAVIGLAYLLMQSKLGQRDMEYVKRIEGAGKLLLAVVNDVLDFSKIDAGRLQLEEAPFQLDDVLDNLSNLVRNRIQEKGLLLEYVVAPETPQTLRGDALRLSQILINLVGNAIKFTAEGSIIVFVNAEPAGDGRLELEFRIQDTGIGMSAEQQTNLFRAFAQADSSVTRKFGGTGLGLVICKRLVEMMGGTIWVESSPQCGSTFAFRICLGMEEARPIAIRSSGYRVLVVDDNDLARSVLANLLRKHACTAEVADSGESALDIIAQNTGRPFDCIMVDLNMPNMDGLALAHQIRSAGGMQSKLVMVTAENVNASRYRHALGDFDDIIEKPATSARIGEVLDKLQADEKTASVAPAQETAPAPLAGLRILVAEDVPTNQLIMRDLLESLGATVNIAENGKLAVTQLAEAGDGFDLILMDIQMPEMDGLEATRRIRAGQVRPDIPIIALTAHALEDERQRAIAAGMNDFLTKPIEPPQMIAVIQRWRPKRAPVQPPTSAVIPAEPGNKTLPELPGIDVEDGLRRMLNRTPLYERILRDFHTRFAGEAERIRQEMGSDSNAASRRAHSLKGTGGMIGATRLASLAATLEQAIKAESPETSVCLEQFENELNRVIDGIRSGFKLG